jgi:hypothetical protein
MKPGYCYMYPLPDWRIVSIRLSEDKAAYNLYLDHQLVECGFPEPQEAASAAQKHDFSSEVATQMFSHIQVTDNLTNDWDCCSIGELNERIKSRQLARANLQTSAGQIVSNGEETAFAN